MSLPVDPTERAKYGDDIQLLVVRKDLDKPDDLEAVWVGLSSLNI